LELGATITHHHAVGRSFRPWYDKEIDPGFVRMMKANKREVDPKWVLNPGILFDRPVS
jgi:alkyldihydroxyacetonephosphate synthase